MKKRKMILSLALICSTLLGGCLFILIIENNISNKDRIKYFVLDGTNKTDLRESEDWVENPIFIDGDATGVGAHNWTWVKNQDWFGGGVGNRTNPYIIENITIDGGNTDKCIEIRDSYVYFKVKNCTLFNSGIGDAGIKLHNVQNGTLIDNNCSFNNGYGIYLYDCYNISISNNTANYNDDEGIYISSSSHNCTISNNTANNNGDNGIRISGDDCTISNNTANNNEDDGIYVSGYNYTISNNRVSNNNEAGIYLSGWIKFNYKVSGNIMMGCGLRLNIVPFAPFQDLSSIKIDNTNKVNNKDLIYYYNEKGLKPSNFSNVGQLILVNCNDSLISDLELSQCSIGITLFYCNNNTILRNTVYKNSEYGIHLNNCHYNNLSINTIYDHSSGIVLIESRNNTIYKNTVSDSHEGIYTSYSNNNTISENTIENNNIGIYLETSLNNTISENTIENNDKGIWLKGAGFIWGCNNNIISYNTIKFNDIGIGLESSHHNIIIGNELLFNEICILENEGCIGNILKNNRCIKYTSDGYSDDDDDDDDDDELIPGYDLYILIGLICAILVIIIKIRRKRYLLEIKN